ncbi:NAD(P)/FAD-dependent oxidoreductase [Candidatus Nitrospira inopinata]|jgi:phytoene dehydrogenase-like protein|uniref:Amine oxidase, flavin-containing n=1 Tax=Candidatus Nitrospira inopinata TaxID=1715989 RepID=A0A0S4KRQ6_9BACT|nr:NAD(P)/FAD-dependent oxidoreductase [Candidatus Nitrospira inopinata]CUQ65896.1 Amine oxidase, flavin-containing [Candidatus Nitrospira inopinata]
MTARPPLLIIGAGLAGLACARRLTQAGVTCTVLEASDGVGGRARTDRVDGFLLDRGFQVLLTGYPEAGRILDYVSLDLKPFHPGALVHYNGRFHLVSDPLRRPQDLLTALFSPIGSLADKRLALRLRRDALQQRLCALAGGAARPSGEVLRDYGFSDAMVTRFFKPFLGGVFLEPTLSTPCWIFEHVWAAFSRGDVALPNNGMGAIAQQLAASLPEGTVRLNQPVKAIEGSTVLLHSGERLEGAAVVIATDSDTALRLRGEPSREGTGRVSTTLYFDAPEPPRREPWLMLNGEEGLVRTVCVLSEAAPSYAPNRRALIAITVNGHGHGQDDLSEKVRAGLESWFGPQVNQWRHLRTDCIRHALPPLDLLPSAPETTSPRLAHGLYQCGDYCESGTLDGALVSGRRAAEAVLADVALS